jgi:hypothetical protein
MTAKKFIKKEHGECESFVGQNLKNFDKNKNTYCITDLTVKLIVCDKNQSIFITLMIQLYVNLCFLCREVNFWSNGKVMISIIAPGSHIHTFRLQLNPNTLIQ